MQQPGSPLDMKERYGPLHEVNVVACATVQTGVVPPSAAMKVRHQTPGSLILLCRKRPDKFGADLPGMKILTRGSGS